MAQSLTSIHLHAVFSTKGRLPYLADRDHREKVHATLQGASQKVGCDLLAVGGVADHVHLLARFGKTISVSDWIWATKRESSSFMKKINPAFSWQAGYGVFAVEKVNVESVIRYIETQEDHHQMFNFQEEFRRLMKENQVDWDEKYMWD